MIATAFFPPVSTGNAPAKDFARVRTFITCPRRKLNIRLITPISLFVQRWNPPRSRLRTTGCAESVSGLPERYRRVTGARAAPGLAGRRGEYIHRREKLGS